MMSVVRPCYCLVLLFFCLITTAVHAGGWGKQASPVVVASAEITPLAPISWHVGSVIPVRQVDLAFGQEGRLTWLVELGQEVRRGQPVARLDQPGLAAEQQRLAAEQADIQVQISLHDKELSRLRVQLKNGHIDPLSVERKASERERLVRQAQANKAAQQGLAVRRDRLQLKAPFDGQIVAQLLQPGAWCRTDEAVVRLFGAAREIEVHAAPHIGRLLDKGQTVAIRWGQDQTGFVHLIRSLHQASAPDRKMALRFALPEHSRLEPGEVVHLALPVATAREVLSVPRDALIIRRDGLAVFRVSADQKAQHLSVTTGIGGADRIEVHGPLQAGDQVVVRGGERLRPGQTVAIQQPHS